LYTLLLLYAIDVINPSSTAIIDETRKNVLQEMNSTITN
jgi:hypothetical protein